MPRFVIYLVAFVVASAGASAQLASDLASRLPKAYETYCGQLIKDGRGDELRMTGEEMVTQREGGKRIGPQDSTWTEMRTGETGRVQPSKKSGWIKALANQGRGILPGAKVPEYEDSYDCKDLIASRFEIAPTESLLFTVGRAPEACNETPFMIQKHGDRWGPKEPLPDLFDYNVEAIWYTGGYVILNVKAEYEYGGRREGLTFWNLEAGWMHSVVAQTDPGVDFDTKHPVPQITEGLGLYLRELASSRIKESQGFVFVESGQHELVFRPAAQEWMLLK